MPTFADKPVIFISYSQTDRAWLDYVRSFFAPLSKQYDLQVWDDEKPLIGSDWRKDLYSALDACRVFIVLVSRYSLASNFVLEEEVPRILLRPKGEVQLCPIVVTPTPDYIARPDWLDDKGRRPRGQRSLLELPDPARDREMAEITEQVDKILQTLSRNSCSAPTQAMSAEARNAFPSIVDYGRLPETPYKKLVGRDAELKRLDLSWRDDKTQVISLVALGGAGKTSLVIEWLTRVRNRAYDNADAVLCWTFYSQGGGVQRAASGEGFLDWALGKLGVKLDTTSSTAKGERLADEFSQRRVLLILDGLEPLQFGAEGQPGALKDRGLRAFLRGLAIKPPAAGHSLVVITSRLIVHDLKKWQNTTAPAIDLGRLSTPAGAALLADAGVEGSSNALRQAAQEFEGHALALSLLAGYLRQLHGGDVRQRARIRSAKKDPDGRGYDQANRVIEAFHTEWLIREPALLAILRMIGLFDRPARPDCIVALRRKPIIKGLNNAIVRLADHTWRAEIAKLREIRLLDPEDASAPDSLDAHPLVREWFGERLKQANPTAWKAAHLRLYSHLRDSTPKKKAPTLDELGPLYQAIVHGCKAGKYRDALNEIYVERLCRWGRNGECEFYTSRRLGAIATDLAAISWLFEKPYVRPVAQLTKADQSRLLCDAAGYLRAQGRLAEALESDRASLQFDKTSGEWGNASISANDLAELLLLFGKIRESIKIAKESVGFAARGRDPMDELDARATFANSRFAATGVAGAKVEFDDLQERALRLRKKSPLSPMPGYYLRDYLLADHQFEFARDASRLSLEASIKSKNLFEIGLDAATLGRAHLGLALVATAKLAERIAKEDCRAAADHFELAIGELITAGQSEDLARGMLARATYHRCTGDWSAAKRDLDEVGDIAESGPMKLFLCDVSLERARLALAASEGFSPLNGLVKGGTPRLSAPNAAQSASLKEEAGRHLADVAKSIATCGYHRRDEEWSELRAVLRGKRKFAELPPRI
jgi:hypothetical protein